jgi:hypothetical protein
MNGRRDVTGRRCRGGAWRTRSRASVAARQVVMTHGAAEVEPAWPQDEVAVHGVVDDEPVRGGVVDDDPARGGVVDDEPTRRGVVNDERRDEPRDKPRDVPRHPDARRSRSSRRRACARRSSRWRAARRAEAPGRAAEAK